MKKFLITLLYVLSSVLALCSILSIFRNVEIRYLKMLDFPRIQLFIASLSSLILLWITTKKWKWFNYLLVFGLFIGLLIHSIFLINYTQLVPVDVPWAKNIRSSDTQLSILLSNVKMTNKKAQPLIDLIQSKKPDLVLAMEVNAWWDKELKVLEKDYPYSHHTPNEVAYGMVLYSKLPITNIEVNYLNNKNVPSFVSTIALTEKKHIIFHATHPVPPTYFKDLPDNEGQQEHALKKLGHHIEDQELPIIVAGDLNDVVWSYVDDLTDTKNKLYDVRVGRGFYNSYNADNFLMRWPLDHVFVTKEFQIRKLERLPEISSDHFPIYLELILDDHD
ncbi:endonuclease/exonuclease/phosphatase family protein [Gelidibacter mesophilus]|uniref:endonuclease/exonuclease/phosphatase family protein n=1 Tax=Gelidibacter mesophilus TaxID=169050 RepID=UPI000428F540|nr:endonuclease/exonuclease/phosphatase family protein [Gelidibacter mesophilus]